MAKKSMQSYVSQTSRARQLNLTFSTLTQGILLAIFYVILIFVLPFGGEMVGTYHMTAGEYRIVRFALAVPAMLVWLFAFVGYSTLAHYAELVKKAPEGEHYNKLAKGTTWLAWSLPITAIISIIVASIAFKWPSFHSSSIIITNYVALIFPLIAFTIIGSASRGMINSAKISFKLASARLIILVFIILGVLYCYFTFSNFDLNSLSSANNPYHLPIWLMLISIIIPYLYMWFIGLLAVYEISIFSRRITGVLYRRPLYWLVSGLGLIVISSIAIQYMNGVMPHMGNLEFNYEVILNVIFHVIGGLGFLVLTAGVLKLKRIEEV